MVEVHRILLACNLRDLAETENGWRAATPFDVPPDPKSSLWVSREGGFMCHRTEKKGHVVELFAHCIGRTVASARATLIKEGMLPRGYQVVREIEKEEKEALGMVESVLSKVSWDHPLDEVSKWRGLPKEAFLHSQQFGAFGFINDYPSLGCSYVFVSSSPPLDGVNPETKGAMVRSSIPKGEWRTVGKYPIWVPEWNVKATEVFLVEGQWDAIALRMAMIQHLPEKRMENVQIMALVGSKDIERFAEIREYLSDKTVYQIPDRDEPNKQGEIIGEKILARTYIALEKTEAKHLLLRIPLGKGKDVNDWYKAGITKDDFDLWMESWDEFRVSNGVVIDSEYRALHKIRLDSMVEIDDDGNPVEIETKRSDCLDPVDQDQLLKIVAPYPMLARYVAECMKVNSGPPIWHLMSFLTYLSAVCGRRFKFESGSQGVLYPMLYTLLVGPSAMGKSQSMMMLQSTAAGTMENLFCAGLFSAESMMDEFAVCSQRMMLFDEFSEWMPRRENEGYKLTALRAFMKLYDAHQYSDQNPFRASYRTKGRSVSVPDPSLAILAACVKEQLVTTQETLMGGLVGRFMFPLGLKRHKWIPVSGSIPDDFKSDIKDFFRSIAATPIRHNDSMRFSVRAMSMYERAHKLHSADMDNKEMALEMATYHGRWAVRVFKLAMLFEILSERQWPLTDSSMIVGQQSLISAIKLCGVLDTCFNSIFMEQFRQGGEMMSRDGKIMSRILKYMKKHANSEGVLHSDIFRFIQEKGRVVQECLDTLIDSRQLMRKEIKTKKQGRPKTVYFLPKMKEDYHAHIETEEIHHEGGSLQDPSSVHVKNGDGKIDGVDKQDGHDRAVETGMEGVLPNDTLRPSVGSFGGEDPGFSQGEDSEMDTFNPA